MLGLPDGVRACLFDMDGVLTPTATIHAAAWKEMFDDFLRTRAASGGTDFIAFDPATDYDAYVDGKLRADGIRSYLASCGIALPEGSERDPASADTVAGLGKRKNAIVLRLLRDGGVQAFPGSVQYVRAARAAGLRTAVVSSSTNTREVLASAGIGELFDARIDGLVERRDRLRGKPAPDSFIAATRAVGVTPAQAVVFEDAVAGVEAGRAGAFAYVVGVDRGGRSADLRSHGADIVVSDLAELLDS